MIVYRVSAPYSPTHAGSIHWRAPDLGIDWPVTASRDLLPPKGLDAGLFKGRDHGF